MTMTSASTFSASRRMTAAGWPSMIRISAISRASPACLPSSSWQKRSSRAWISWRSCSSPERLISRYFCSESTLRTRLSPVGPSGSITYRSTILASWRCASASAWRNTRYASGARSVAYRMLWMVGIIGADSPPRMKTCPAPGPQPALTRSRSSSAGSSPRLSSDTAPMSSSVLWYPRCPAPPTTSRVPGGRRWPSFFSSVSRRGSSAG